MTQSKSLPLPRRIYDAINGKLAKPRVLVWPPIDSVDRLDDILPRLRFHFRGDRKVVVAIASPEIRPSGAMKGYMGRYDDACNMELRVMRDRGQSLVRLAIENEAVVLADVPRDPDWAEWKKTLPNVADINPDVEEYETLRVAKLFADRRGGILAESKAKFLAWRDRLPKRDKVYILCTGPSLSRYAEFDFSDGIVIGCNSAVSNPGLLHHAPPHMVVAADPVFHFGPSIYAEQFRRDLAAAARQVPFHFLTMDSYSHVVPHHIAMPADRVLYTQQQWRHPVTRFVEDWKVPAQPNVLTLLMLPIAFALGKRIFIIGADGREPKETYFWKHDPASQLNDKMSAAKAAHPAFFAKRDYAGYYEKHCDELKKQIEEVEKAGATVRSLTPSFIPALATRPAS